MQAGLRALLTGFIDYAGLFPPAKLPLDQAFANFLRYRRDAESWLLRTFVCPVEKLAELQPYAREFEEGGQPLRLALLATPSPATDWKGFLQGLIVDLERTVDFKKKHKSRVAYDSYEMKIPDELCGEDRFDDFHTLVHGNFGFLDENGAAPERAFYEVRFDPARFQMPAMLLSCFVEDDERRKGFKLRCGGATAAAIPSLDEVAFAVLACRAPSLPLKLTAGLHHPLRHFDKGLGCPLHGFVNVFCAGALAATLDDEDVDANTALIKELLADEDPKNFTFDTDGFAWRARRVGLDTIAASRKTLTISQGSCSFDEPREDLRALGWL